MSIYLQDSFLGAANSLLTSHTSDSGAAWLKDTGQDPSSKFYTDNDGTVGAQLTGSGGVRSATNGATTTFTAVSGISAPQFSVYVQFSFKVGTYGGSTSAYHSYLYQDPHQQGISPHPPTNPTYGTEAGTQSGAVLLFAGGAGSVQVYAPFYCTGATFPTAQAGNAYITVQDAPFAAGTTHVVRWEYDFDTGHEVRCFMDGTHVASWPLATSTGLAYPGNLLLVADNSSMSTSVPTILSALECGTLGAPPYVAFWTDFTGAVIEHP